MVISAVVTAVVRTVKNTASTSVWEKRGHNSLKNGRSASFHSSAKILFSTIPTKNPHSRCAVCKENTICSSPIIYHRIENLAHQCSTYNAKQAKREKRFLFAVSSSRTVSFYARYKHSWNPANSCFCFIPVHRHSFTVCVCIIWRPIHLPSRDDRHPRRRRRRKHVLLVHMIWMMPSLMIECVWPVFSLFSAALDSGRGDNESEEEDFCMVYDDDGEDEARRGQDWQGRQEGPPWPPLNTTKSHFMLVPCANLVRGNRPTCFEKRGENFVRFIFFLHRNFGEKPFCCFLQFC